MLRLLEASPNNPLPSLKQDGQLPEAVFKVAARMRLEWVAVGVPTNGAAPFDLEAFIEEVRKQSEGV
jgi:hypothetical protein